MILYTLVPLLLPFVPDVLKEETLALLEKHHGCITLVLAHNVAQTHQAQQELRTDF